MLTDIAKHYNSIFTSNYKEVVILELKKALEGLSGLVTLSALSPRDSNVPRGHGGGGESRVRPLISIVPSYLLLLPFTLKQMVEQQFVNH